MTRTKFGASFNGENLKNLLPNRDCEAYKDCLRDSTIQIISDQKWNK